MEKYLVAFDGSDNAIKALQQGILLAKVKNAEVTVLIVIPEASSPLYAYKQVVYGGSPTEVATMLNLNNKADKTALETLEKAQSLLKDSGAKEKFIVARGHPADIICYIAEEEKYDLIILGRKGHGMIKRFLLGSVSSNVAHSSKTNVLLVN